MRIKSWTLSGMCRSIPWQYCEMGFAWVFVFWQDFKDSKNRDWGFGKYRINKLYARWWQHQREASMGFWKIQNQ